MNLNKALYLCCALVLLSLLAGCATASKRAIPDEILASQVELMARTGYKSLPTISAAGRIRVDTDRARGSADFLLLYDPEKGLRIDVVDPLYRPVLSAIVNDSQLWMLDHKKGTTGVAKPQALFEDLTGIAIPDIDFIPLILGKIPPGTYVVSQEPGCADDENSTCYALRDQAGLLHCRVGVSNHDGAFTSLTLPTPGSEQGLLQAEFTGSHQAGIPKKIKIHHLRTDDFVIIRYTDIVFGEQLDPKMFDPKRFHDDQ